ncbi:MAG: hypothetical protein ACI8W1_001228, partial [Candidatus Azotimanducaceae bacterium]
MTKKPTTRAKEKEKDKEIASLKKQLTSAKKE